MIATVKRGRPSMQNEIDRWLSDLLSAGSRQANEILQAGELRGYSLRTLKRAKKRLNLEAIQKRRAWYWRDPEIPEAKEPEDFQKKMLHKMDEIERKVQLPRAVTEEGVAPEIKGQVDDLGYSKDVPLVTVRQVSMLDIIQRVKQLLKANMDHDEITRRMLAWAYPASGMPETIIVATLKANGVIVKPKSDLFQATASVDVSF